MAHKLAMASPHVVADAVSAADFPQLVQRYDVMAVPRVIVNEKSVFEGAPSERDFVAGVIEAAAQD